jgi:ABC-type transport system involved in multi-copper enzyme maturation permease subunit
MATLALRLLSRLWPILAFCGAMTFAFAFLFIALIEPLGGVGLLQSVMRMVPRIGQMLGSAEIDPTSIGGFASIAYVHPLISVLFLVWPLAVAASALAGDVESGEADLILSRAVPRRAMLQAAGLTVLAGAVALGVLQWLGTAIGVWVAVPSEAMPLGRFAGAAAVNALLVISMGGVLTLISALSSDRGRVIAAGVALWFVNFFCGAAAPMFKSLAWLKPWSLQGHVRPQSVVSTGHLPHFDNAVLLAVAVAGFALAAWVWARRDIRG